MHRRQLLRLAAASAIPVALVANHASAQTDAAMGDAEKKHATETKTVGSLSLATSRVAAEKASDAKVKQFALWEVAEQETIADILKTMEAGSMKAEGALKPPTPEETTAMLDEAGKKAVADLSAMEGAGFDKAYVAAQLDGHNKLLAIQEDYLNAGQNREHLGVAKLARGQIKEHIDHLEELGKMG